MDDGNAEVTRKDIYGSLLDAAALFTWLPVGNDVTSKWNAVMINFSALAVEVIGRRVCAETVYEFRRQESEGIHDPA